MLKLVMVCAAVFAVLAFSMSPLDARASEPAAKREDLRRDVERISREIYPGRSERSERPSSRGSFAAGRSTKKR